eukprot:TRINITY_DN18728_c0_g1_i4.p1 TRINITY_DN18728_c0_g1~~TRINITY_DN18728_c0_g1_i4.p1  ORF type:complete len:381 (-),score=50.24 TRINITY_DN18728_c0_g1_i4:19-1161(-)
MDLMHEPLAALLEKRLPDEFLQTGGRAAVAAVPEALWANINRAGQWNERHDHMPEDACSEDLVASCVFYPVAAENSSFAKLRLFPEGDQEIEIQPHAGMLVLFPSDLLHAVDPGQPGEGPRLSLAFNLYVRWLSTPLLQAAWSGRSGEVHRLLSSGADPEEADLLLGFQPMHLAAEAGHATVVELLLESLANPAAEAHEGPFPLLLAADRGHVDIIHILLEAYDATSVEDGAAPREHGPEDDHPFDNHAFLALQAATSRGHTAIVNGLLEQQRFSQLDRAALACESFRTAALSGHGPLMALLLAQGAASRGVEDTHLLLEVAKAGHVEAMQVMASDACGAGMDASDEGGVRALHWAAGQGHARVASLLLASRASLHVTQV